MIDALLLANDGCCLGYSVGEFEWRKVTLLHGPSDEASSEATSGGAVGEPGVDVGLVALRGCRAVLTEVNEEV